MAPTLAPSAAGGPRRRLTDWFNHRRLLGPIGHVPPAEAEARFHGQLENAAMAA